MKRIRLFMSFVMVVIMMAMCPQRLWAVTYDASVTSGGELKGYATLREAFAAASVDGKSSTVKLLKDCEYACDQEFYATLTTGIITFDLNGHTLKCTGGYHSILDLEGANLTIVDSSDGQSGTITGADNGSSFALYYVSGKLTANAGTFIGGCVALYAMDATQTTAGSIVLHGGKFVGETGDEMDIYFDSGTNTAVWSMIDMDGYCFMNEDNTVVATNSHNPTLVASSGTSLTVKTMSAESSNVSVTINGVTSYYLSLVDAATAAAAGTAAKPATIKILKDITIDAGLSAALTTGVVTLDLNGKTVIGTNSQILKLSGNSNLTVIDSSEGKTGAMTNNSGHGIYAVGCTLTIHAGTITAGNMGFGVWATNCTVSLDGGCYRTKGSYSGVNINGETSGLADGYAYYDISNNMLTDSHNIPIMAYNSTSTQANYIVVKEADAVVTVTIDGVTTKHTSLTAAATAAAAGTAAKPATIKLLMNITLSSGTGVDFTSGVATLDLNGTTLSGNNSYIINVNGADLTITDNSAAKTGKVKCAGSAIQYTLGKLTVNDGEFNCNGMALLASDASMTDTKKIVLHGGIFDAGDTNSSIIVPYDYVKETCNWGIVDMEGYYFINKNGYAVGTNDDVPVVPEPVKVVAAPTTVQAITLDETVLYAYHPSWSSKLTYNVTMKRTLTSGKWNTVCFPFSMSADEVKGKFGAETKMMKVTNITTDDQVIFADATEIEANGFYIVKPGQDVSEFTLNGKTLTNWLWSYCNNTYTDYTINANNYKYVFDGDDITNYDNYVLHDGQFKVIDTVDSDIKAFRWDISISNSGSAKALTANVDLSDGATGIEEIGNGELEMENSAAYNLAGQRVGAGAKGIIIKNGKKYFNK